MDLFHLYVALPHWRQNKPPGDKLVNEEDNVLFECHADGIPRPQIAWLIDGMQIECMLHFFRSIE